MNRRELKVEWRDAERDCGGVEDALVRRQRVVAVREEDEAEGAREERESRRVGK